MFFADSNDTGEERALKYLAHSDDCAIRSAVTDAGIAAVSVDFKDSRSTILLIVFGGSCVRNEEAIDFAKAENCAS